MHPSAWVTNTASTSVCNCSALPATDLATDLAVPTLPFNLCLQDSKTIQFAADRYVCCHQLPCDSTCYASRHLFNSSAGLQGAPVCGRPHDAAAREPPRLRGRPDAHHLQVGISVQQNRLIEVPCASLHEGSGQSTSVPADQTAGLLHTLMSAPPCPIVLCVQPLCLPARRMLPCSSRSTLLQLICSGSPPWYLCSPSASLHEVLDKIVANRLHR